MTKELQDKFEELIDRLEALEEAVYEGPDDTDDLEDDDCACDDDDCCCDDEDDRAWKETDPFVERLHHLSTSQLEHLMEEAEWILEERHREGQEYVCPECQAQADHSREIDTTDELFSDFAAYVAVHPELRFYQALTNWSGYKKILGEDDREDRYDLFHETTKGPKKGAQPAHGHT